MWAIHYTDGSWTESYPPHRGLSFGDGVFETVRIHEGRPLFWDSHRTRLCAALHALALQLPCPWEALEKQIRRLAHHFPQSRVKILAIRAGEGAYTPSTHEVLLWLIAQPLPHSPAYPLSSPQKLILYPHPLLIETPWSAFKTLSALAYVQAARYAAERGFHDALLLHVKGYIAETSRANLFWFDGEVLHTPPLSTGAVSGVFRQQVITIAHKLGIPVQETLTTPTALTQAKEIFTTNVIQGIAPISLIKLPNQDFGFLETKFTTYLSRNLQEAIGKALREL